MNNSDKKDEAGSGISIKRLNYILAAITVVMAIVLIIVSYDTSLVYNDFRDTAADFMAGQKSAYDLQAASDYLTEQARSFVETGDRYYLDNYFEESEVTKRRDNALAELGEVIGEDNDVYIALKKAYDSSIKLMQREYYAMRLTIEARGYDLTLYPSGVASIVLTPTDSSATAEQKSLFARRMVFDETYRLQKETVSGETRSCLQKLTSNLEAQQLETSRKLAIIVVVERILVICLVAMIAAIVLLTAIQVIRPIHRAINRIREDKPVPIGGSSELRFFARVYNRMYEENRKRKERLAYEASHDPLTGAFNRNGFEAMLSEIDFRSTALLLIDIDKFKSINDTYGHDMGDKVLIHVSSTISRHFRSDDSLCRIGGDEFVLLMYHLPDTAEDLVTRKIESINKELKNPPDGLPATSLSVGVAFGGDAEGDRLFKNADEALYEVKRNGRSGCAFYKK